MGVVSGCLVSSFVVVSKIERFPQKARTFPFQSKSFCCCTIKMGGGRLGACWRLPTYRLTSINDKCHYYVWLIILRKFIAQ